MFFRKATRQAKAVIAAFHAAFGRLQMPEDALAEAAYSAVARQVLRRHRASGYESLPARALRELAMMLVLVHEDRPSFDRALVFHGIAADDIASLRARAERRPERREQARLALRATLADARARRAAARVAAATFAEKAAVQARAVAIPVVPAAVVQSPALVAEPPRLAA
ncbi:MAG: hypothetical protein HXX10_08320 [Rhodoplanes sp.]|uniref:hypothetical protein n=1 Tax=Rhodoplanes sp. TaxID=1968906 RepID=UPI0017E3FD2A|nr:hypothetical protein [Rhodoplanes sp.]NVO14027.1 hypothetical protein [Rhodoplanes sp.]